MGEWHMPMLRSGSFWPMPYPAGKRDELSAARGVMNGVALGTMAWSLIGLLVGFLV